MNQSAKSETLSLQSSTHSSRSNTLERPSKPNKDSGLQPRLPTHEVFFLGFKFHELRHYSRKNIIENRVSTLKFELMSFFNFYNRENCQCLFYKLWVASFLIPRISRRLELFFSTFDYKSVLIIFNTIRKLTTYISSMIFSLFNNHFLRFIFLLTWFLMHNLWLPS